MAFEEKSWQMNSAPDKDVKSYEEAEAMQERIREWLATPEGTVAHNPSWGHTLRRFKHDPLAIGNGLDILITMELVRKMPIDIDDLRLVAVNVDVLDIDLCKLTIVHQYGVQQETIQL